MNKITDETERILLDVKGLKKYFPITRGFFRRAVGYIKALDDISLQIYEGKTLGLAGESGCGKTTAGRVILRMLEPTAGKITFYMDNQAVDLSRIDGRQLKPFRRRIAMIFQDPASSLNPRLTVKEIVGDPLIVHKAARGKKLEDIVVNLLELVGLKADYMSRYPHEFSGGQKQRIGIARALVLRPKLIIADEPVSALDMSIQAQILALLENLQKEFGFAYLFISHDLRTVKYMSSKVAIMYLGKIVEIAEGSELYKEPKHPYTEALISAVPTTAYEKKTKRIVLKGDVPNPADPPSGCHFHPRCPYAVPACSQSEPVLQQLSSESQRQVSCHLAKDLNLKGIET